MKKIAALFALSLAASLDPALAAAPQTIPVPREKVSLTCTDDYFKSARQNFLLSDEVYPSCTLKMPLALHERWPGRRTFYVIPRVSASLHSANAKGEGKWQPLTPLVTPGADPLHEALDSRDYAALELTGKVGKLSALTGENKPDMVSAGGKITVCAAPVYRGEEPCQTYDLAARFKVYTK